MYIGDNVLSGQGFYWFTMAYDGVIFISNHVLRPQRGPQFVLSFEIFLSLYPQLGTYRDQKQTAKAAYHEFERMEKNSRSVDQH